MTFTEEDIQAVTKLLRAGMWPSASYWDAQRAKFSEEFEEDVHQAAVEICALLKVRIEAR